MTIANGQESDATVGFNLQEVHFVKLHKALSTRRRWWHYLIGIVVIAVCLLANKFTPFGYTWYGGGLLIAIASVGGNWLLRNNNDSK